MRDTKARLAAVKHRAREIETKRSFRLRCTIAGFTLVVSFLLITGLSFMMPSLLANSPITDYTQPGVTASIFDISNSIGYILIGILAFVLGVAITILFHRIHLRNKKDQDDKYG